VTESTDLERITRRGIQIFRLTLAMEAGDEGSGSGVEALLYLSDAAARVAALSPKPRQAIAILVDLLSKIDNSWFETNRARREPEDDLFTDLALEVGLGSDEAAKMPAGVPHAYALNLLVNAIVNLAALNSEPRRILELVGQRLEGVGVEAARKA
jgi:hypothetical protein